MLGYIEKVALGIAVLSLTVMITLPCCAPYASSNDGLFVESICGPQQ